MKVTAELMYDPEAPLDEAVDFFDEPLVLPDERAAFRNNFVAKTVGYVAAAWLDQSQRQLSDESPDGKMEQYFTYIDELLVRPPENCSHLLPNDKTKLMEMQGYAYLGLDAWDAFFYSGIPRVEYNRRLDQLASYVRACHDTVSFPEHIIPKDERIEREHVIAKRLSEMGIGKRDHELILALQSGLKTRNQLMEEYDLSRPGVSRVVRSVVYAMAEKYGHDDALTIDLATDLMPHGTRQKEGFQFPSRPQKRALVEAAGGPKARAKRGQGSKKTRKKEGSEDLVEKEPSLLLRAEEEVELAMAIEAGRNADDELKQSDEISAERLAELQVLKEKGDAAFARFVKANEGLVRYFIRGKRSVIEEGGIKDIFSIVDDVTEKGLMHAIRKFDYRLGYKFSSYAGNWIKSAIDRTVAARQPIKIGIEAYGLMRRLVAHRSAAFKETGRHMSNAELADFFNVSEKRVADLFVTHALLKGKRDFQAPLRAGDTKPISLENVTADSKQLTEEDVVLGVALKDAFSKLDEKQRYVVEHRFGLNGKEVLRDAEIAEHLELTVNAVRAMRKKALASMSLYFKEED